jgi:hypothetical protein
MVGAWLDNITFELLHETAHACFNRPLRDLESKRDTAPPPMYFRAFPARMLVEV